MCLEIVEFFVAVISVAVIGEGDTCHGSISGCDIGNLIAIPALLCAIAQGRGSRAPAGSQFDIFASLASDEITYLNKVPTSSCSFASRTIIVEEGRPVSGIIGIVSGWAACMRNLVDGRRQIIGFVLPGDILDGSWSGREHIGQSVVAMNTVEAIMIPESVVVEIPNRCPNLNTALTKQASRNYAILEEHTVRLGRRTAIEKIAHLLLEIDHRLSAVQLSDNGRFVVEATQQELADALGLTSVHVNRTLKMLREQGLIAVHGRLIALKDRARLTELAEFGVEYLE